MASAKHNTDTAQAWHWADARSAPRTPPASAIARRVPRVDGQASETRRAGAEHVLVSGVGVQCTHYHIGRIHVQSGRA